MMLGDVLTAARHSGAGIETWLKPADAALWNALSAEAERQARALVTEVGTALALREGP